MKNLIPFLILLISSAATASTESFGIIADAGNNNYNMRLIKASLKQGNIHQLILPGDNLYNPEWSYESVWNHWLDSGFKFSVVALGNHYKTIEEEINYFQMPGAHFVKSINGVNFIVLDSEQKQYAKENAEFFEKTISKFTHDDIVIVTYHHPTVSVTRFHHWKEREEFQNYILPIMKKYRENIDLVLVGHDHITSFFTVNDIPFVISGATMEIRRSGHFSHTDRDRGLKVKTKWYYNNHDPYWARLDVNTENKDIWINFVNAKKKRVECSLKIANNKYYMKKNCY